MKLESMPGCCTARVIHDLVFANRAEWSSIGYSHGESKTLDIQLLHTFIQRSFNQGDGIIIVTLNSTQKYIIPQLLEFGFVEDTDWVKKREHSRTPIKLLHLTQDKYNQEACKKNKET